MCKKSAPQMQRRIPHRDWTPYSWDNLFHLVENEHIHDWTEDIWEDSKQRWREKVSLTRSKNEPSASSNFNKYQEHWESMAKDPLACFTESYIYAFNLFLNEKSIFHNWMEIRNLWPYPTSLEHEVSFYLQVFKSEILIFKLFDFGHGTFPNSLKWNSSIYNRKKWSC